MWSILGRGFSRLLVTGTYLGPCQLRPGPEALPQRQDASCPGTTTFSLLCSEGVRSCSLAFTPWVLFPSHFDRI